MQLTIFLESLVSSIIVKDGVVDDGGDFDLTLCGRFAPVTMGLKVGSLDSEYFENFLINLHGRTIIQY